jgi:hypothetical protein
MFAIIADGQAWIGPDGQEVWTEDEALSLGAMLDALGYSIRLVQTA